MEISPYHRNSRPVLQIVKWSEDRAQVFEYFLKHTVSFGAKQIYICLYTGIGCCKVGTKENSLVQDVKKGGQ
jgi:hypothetical protein